MSSNYTNGYYQPNQSVIRPSQSPPVMPMQQIFGLKGRPVSSIEEVRATSIDFDGSVFFFPDLANKRIYTKQIGMDGLAVINMYEYKQPMMNEQEMSNANFITRQEFEETLGQIRSMLQNRVQEQPQPQQQESGNFNF